VGTRVSKGCSKKPRNRPLKAVQPSYILLIKFLEIRKTGGLFQTGFSPADKNGMKHIFVFISEAIIKTGGDGSPMQDFPFWASQTGYKG